MKKIISLWGKWEFELDNDMYGISEHYEIKPFSDSIYLPTTTSEARKGIPNSEKLLGSLTLQYKTTGCAWYRKDIIIKPEDLGKTIHLLLERTRISHVWIDDSYVGTFNSLCASHIYDLSPFLCNSSHRLTIMTLNADYSTNGGHMTSPDTQTNWNGILGNIDLIIYDKVYIKSVTSFCHYEKKAVSLSLVCINNSSQPMETCFVVTPVDLSADSEKSNKTLESYSEVLTLIPGENYQELTYKFNTDIKYWDEFNPNLYQISVSIYNQNRTEKIDNQDILFGMHNFNAEKEHFSINGFDTFLRGKHDGMVFPLTGYAPMNTEDWLQVMSTAKEYGINHYRFHTCCPPEAAFRAADILGIYMSPELPFWGTFHSKEDEKYDEKAQKYLEEEGYRILASYGNHPSFVMMSLGNELWGDPDSINDLLRKFKDFDNRPLYSQGSNNFQFAPRILQHDDFFVGVRFSENRLFRGSYAMCDAPQGHIQTQRPSNKHNYDNLIRPTNDFYDPSLSETVEKKEIEIQFETTIKKVVLDGNSSELITNMPVISHEIGQYSFYPDFNEIAKYTGVTQARNLIMIQEMLREKNLLQFTEDYFKASGLFAIDCYKAELETALRSKELAGFQLLDLQDFPGQGTALVGILDSFMCNKGLITSDKWQTFCSPVTIQAVFSSYVYSSNEALNLQFILCNYSQESFHKAALHYTLSTDNQCYYDGTVTNVNSLSFGVDTIGSEILIMPETEIPLLLKLSITLEGTNITNCYSLYLYPETKVIPISSYTNNVKNACELALQGKSVLLLTDSESNPNSIEGTYCTDFWCFSMFRSISEGMGKKTPVGTLGLLIQNNHPALSEFPCENYSTPQWWNIVMNSRATILDKTDIVPIVHTIDNVERNHRLGLIYEVSISDSQDHAGKILVCTSPLNKLCSEDTPEINNLMQSLVHYCSSDLFNPDTSISSEEFAGLFTMSGC